MDDKQIKKLFIEHCVSDKHKPFLSDPMNTRDEGKYEAFKIGLLLAEKR